MNYTEPRLSFLDAALKSRPIALIAFESVIFAMLEVITLIGNFMTMYLIFKRSGLRGTPTNLLIASLAVSDFTMGAFSMHLLVTVLITSKWPFGNGICQYQGFISIVLAAASTQTLAWTAINRYFRVVKSTHYIRLFSLDKTKLIMCQIWIASLIAPLPYLLAGYQFVFHPGKFFCYLDIDISWFTAVLVVVYVGLPSTTIFFCYFKVYQMVRRHNSRLSQYRSGASGGIKMTNEEIRTTHTLFVIVIVFIACWTPVLIIDIIDTIDGKWSLPRAAYTLYTFLATISNAINPFIYGLMNPTLRGGYLDLLQFMRRKPGGKKYKLRGERKRLPVRNCNTVKGLMNELTTLKS
ncbi:melatonin receptor type 1B-B-like [Actinia tenebrosa]|uniref:Melatonin receptor type 1B-B-like n=1 Tax=Actinia tenebrosa TaxID=6105 RepID=A0A6P8IXN7_ACTTE|nr:melatonin receptor type 1B-B-like [Actinia tenebrosa]